jgi:undecaprenyl-diphosphatase
MTLIQIIFLALVQGAAELLPVSSSAHVIVAEKLMGLDPSSPDMTFFLVMLHTGTMFAVLVYFGSRWRRLLSVNFIKMIVIATACTGVVGLALKKIIEKIMVGVMFHGSSLPAGGMPKAEIEELFKYLPLIAFALFCAGALIIYSSKHEKAAKTSVLTSRSSALIGVVQGLCLPFRGFSRSGATISTGMITGLDRTLTEEFSFALAVVLTPPVIALELHRLHKVTGSFHPDSLTPGLLGMVFAFASGLLALRWLSSWLENGRWGYFGYYCLAASATVAGMAAMGY